MGEIPVAEAARRLSISDVAAYEALRAGRLVRVQGSSPARVTAESVQRMATQRRSEALRRRDGDAVSLARYVDERLHGLPGAVGFPQPFAVSPTRGRAALRLLPDDARAIFGADVLEAAASRDRLRKDGACPTCWAHASARVHQTRPPEDDQAYRLLLGEPCPADRQRWAAEAIARRRAMEELTRREAASRQAAEQERVRAEFRAAQQESETAAQRVRTAARAYAALDPSVARQAGVQARRRAGFTASGDMACGCTADRYVCREHTQMFGTTDRRQVRR
ncbi:hypothetical protein OG252_07540 [Streptomyces sp. NBC_01352]|uniref:hypothetical protein n=1 Tax=Streptomyces sp. NBC_01352 TaxID=2903834 RepID=UPI002E2F9888|nr:hypothetical protein [Streptomyces sp. NBC_01352]